MDLMSTQGFHKLEASLFFKEAFSQRGRNMLGITPKIIDTKTFGKKLTAILRQFKEF